MDQTLAAIYGTAQVTEEDVEKTAAAELAEKLAAGEEIDEETLEALANEVLAAEGEETAAAVEEPAAEEAVEAAAEGSEEAAVEEPAEKTAEAEETEEVSEEQQKIAEADYLGRVMAHAYAQESREIEKQAGLSSRNAARLTKAGMLTRDAAGKVGAHLSKHKNKYQTAGAAAVGVTAGAALKKGKAAKGKEKKSSALETLMEARAAEILQENGIDPAILSQEPEKQADAETVNPYDTLASKVEEGAWELLKSRGLVEESVEETTQE